MCFAEKAKFVLRVFAGGGGRGGREGTRYGRERDGDPGRTETE